MGREYWVQFAPAVLWVRVMMVMKVELSLSKDDLATEILGVGQPDLP